MSIKESDIKTGVQKTINDSSYLNELLEKMGPEKISMHERELASKIVMELSESNPDSIYPKWSIFVDYLKAQNAYTRLVAHIILSNLTKTDSLNLIDQDLDKYLRIIHDESVMVCMHSIENFSKIINSRPDLEQIITAELLETNTNLFRHKHKELIKGSVIKTFMEYFTQSNFQKEIIGFVKNQKNSSSGKTKKLAKEFLKKYSWR
jgi:hypothetical protein